MLALCIEFFSHLNQQGTRYCHWKSNEHLDQALAGKTDLDVLVHIDDKHALNTALAEFNFKEILSPEAKQFPGMSDYLGFDNETGEFIHLHVHHFLVLGQKYIKNHYLALEDWMFSNLVMKDNVYIPCPEIELLLLTIRAHLKVDVISLAKHAIKDFSSAQYTAFPRDIENEFHALIKRSDHEKFNELLAESQLPLDVNLFQVFFQRFSNNELSALHLFIAQRSILRSLRHYRRSNSPIVFLKYARFTVSEWPVIRKVLTFKRKKILGRGKIISLVGADGSGKSTLINDINKWLKWKLTVNQYYYGIPKNAIKRVNYYLNRIFDRFNLPQAKEKLEVYYWLYVARNRVNISATAQVNANNGHIVITDRFPLKQFREMPEPMDGPRLGQNPKFADTIWTKREEEIYNLIEDSDITFALQVELEELRRRKTDLDMETHTTKANAVNNLEANGSLVLIDANRPYDEVLLDLKRRIWNAI